MIFAISTGMGVVLRSANTNEAKLWVGVTYAAAEAGHSNEACAGLGVVGVAQVSLWGLGVGGPAGAAVGAVFGL